MPEPSTSDPSSPDPGAGQPGIAEQSPLPGAELAPAADPEATAVRPVLPLPEDQPTRTAPRTATPAAEQPALPLTSPDTSATAAPTAPDRTAAPAADRPEAAPAAAEPAEWSLTPHPLAQAALAAAEAPTAAATGEPIEPAHLAPTPDAASTRPKTRRRGRWLGVLVALLLVLGLGGAAGWFGYGTDVLGRARARDAIATLNQDWSAAPTDPVTASQRAGQPMAILTIPKLNLTWPVVVGTDALTRGVGWYPGTTWPGERGNAALAGLRATGGSPFRHLDDLVVGDTIVLTTATAVLTYTVTVPATAVTVDQNDAWVLDPVPGHPGTPPVESLLTLTTAQDLVATSERSVCFATLVSSTPR